MPLPPKKSFGDDSNIQQGAATPPESSLSGLPPMKNFSEPAQSESAFSLPKNEPAAASSTQSPQVTAQQQVLPEKKQDELENNPNPWEEFEFYDQFHPTQRKAMFERRERLISSADYEDGDLTKNKVFDLGQPGSLDYNKNYMAIYGVEETRKQIRLQNTATKGQQNKEKIDAGRKEFLELSYTDVVKKGIFPRTTEAQANRSEKLLDIQNKYSKELESAKTTTEIKALKKQLDIDVEAAEDDRSYMGDWWNAFQDLATLGPRAGWGVANEIIAEATEDQYGNDVWSTISKRGLIGQGYGANKKANGEFETVSESLEGLVQAFQDDPVRVSGMLAEESTTDIYFVMATLASMGTSGAATPVAQARLAQIIAKSPTLLKTINSLKNTKVALKTTALFKKASTKVEAATTTAKTTALNNKLNTGVAAVKKSLDVTGKILKTPFGKSISKHKSLMAVGSLTKGMVMGGLAGGVQGVVGNKAMEIDKPFWSTFFVEFMEEALFDGAMHMATKSYSSLDKRLFTKKDITSNEAYQSADNLVQNRILEAFETDIYSDVDPDFAPPTLSQDEKIALKKRVNADMARSISFLNASQDLQTARDGDGIISSEAMTNFREGMEYLLVGSVTEDISVLENIAMESANNIAETGDGNMSFQEDVAIQEVGGIKSKGQGVESQSFETRMENGDILLKYNEERLRREYETLGQEGGEFAERVIQRNGETSPIVNRQKALEGVDWNEVQAGLKTEEEWFESRANIEKARAVLVKGIHSQMNPTSYTMKNEYNKASMPRTNNMKNNKTFQTLLERKSYYTGMKASGKRDGIRDGKFDGVSEHPRMLAFEYDYAENMNSLNANTSLVENYEQEGSPLSQSYLVKQAAHVQLSEQMQDHMDEMNLYNSILQKDKGDNPEILADLLESEIEWEQLRIQMDALKGSPVSDFEAHAESNMKELHEARALIHENEQKMKMENPDFKSQNDYDKNIASVLENDVSVDVDGNGTDMYYETRTDGTKSYVVRVNTDNGGIVEKVYHQNGEQETRKLNIPGDDIEGLAQTNPLFKINESLQLDLNLDPIINETSRAEIDPKRINFTLDMNEDVTNPELLETTQDWVNQVRETWTDAKSPDGSINEGLETETELELAHLTVAIHDAAASIQSDFNSIAKRYTETQLRIKSELDAINKNDTMKGDKIEKIRDKYEVRLEEGKAFQPYSVKNNQGSYSQPFMAYLNKEIREGTGNSLTMPGASKMLPVYFNLDGYYDGSSANQLVDELSRNKTIVKFPGITNAWGKNHVWFSGTTKYGDVRVRTAIPKSAHNKDGYMQFLIPKTEVANWIQRPYHNKFKVIPDVAGTHVSPVIGSEMSDGKKAELKANGAPTNREYMKMSSSLFKNSGSDKKAVNVTELDIGVEVDLVNWKDEGQRFRVASENFGGQDYKIMRAIGTKEPLVFVLDGKKKIFVPKSGNEDLLNSYRDSDYNTQSLRPDAMSELANRATSNKEHKIQDAIEEVPLATKDTPPKSDVVPKETAEGETETDAASDMQELDSEIEKIKNQDLNTTAEGQEILDAKKQSDYQKQSQSFEIKKEENKMIANTGRKVGNQGDLGASQDQGMQADNRDNYHYPHKATRQNRAQVYEVQPQIDEFAVRDILKNNNATHQDVQKLHGYKNEESLSHESLGVINELVQKFYGEAAIHENIAAVDMNANTGETAAAIDLPIDWTLSNSNRNVAASVLQKVHGDRQVIEKRPHEFWDVENADLVIANTNSDVRSAEERYKRPDPMRKFQSRRVYDLVKGLNSLKSGGLMVATVPRHFFDTKHPGYRPEYKEFTSRMNKNGSIIYAQNISKGKASGEDMVVFAYRRGEVNVEQSRMHGIAALGEAKDAKTALRDLQAGNMGKSLAHKHKGQMQVNRMERTNASSNSVSDMDTRPSGNESFDVNPILSGHIDGAANLNSREKGITRDDLNMSEEAVSKITEVSAKVLQSAKRRNFQDPLVQIVVDNPGRNSIRNTRASWPTGFGVDFEGNVDPSMMVMTEKGELVPAEDIEGLSQMISSQNAKFPASDIIDSDGSYSSKYVPVLQQTPEGVKVTIGERYQTRNVHSEIAEQLAEEFPGLKTDIISSDSPMSGAQRESLMKSAESGSVNLIVTDSKNAIDVTNYNGGTKIIVGGKNENGAINIDPSADKLGDSYLQITQNKRTLDEATRAKAIRDNLHKKYDGEVNVFMDDFTAAMNASESFVNELISDPDISQNTRLSPFENIFKMPLRKLQEIIKTQKQKNSTREQEIMELTGQFEAESKDAGQEGLAPEQQQQLEGKANQVRMSSEYTSFLQKVSQLKEQSELLQEKVVSAAVEEDVDARKVTIARVNDRLNRIVLQDYSLGGMGENSGLFNLPKVQKYLNKSYSKRKMDAGSSKKELQRLEAVEAARNAAEELKDEFPGMSDMASTGLISMALERELDFQTEEKKAGKRASISPKFAVDNASEMAKHMWLWTQDNVLSEAREGVSPTQIQDIAKPKINRETDLTGESTNPYEKDGGDLKNEEEYRDRKNTIDELTSSIQELYKNITTTGKQYRRTPAKDTEARTNLRNEMKFLQKEKSKMEMDVRELEALEQQVPMADVKDHHVSQRMAEIWNNAEYRKTRDAHLKRIEQKKIQNEEDLADAQEQFAMDVFGEGEYQLPPGFGGKDLPIPKSREAESFLKTYNQLEARSDDQSLSENITRSQGGFVSSGAAKLLGASGAALVAGAYLGSKLDSEDEPNKWAKRGMTAGLLPLVAALGKNVKSVRQEQNQTQNIRGTEPRADSMTESGRFNGETALNKAYKKAKKVTQIFDFIDTKLKKMEDGKGVNGSRYNLTRKLSKAYSDKQTAYAQTINKIDKMFESLNSKKSEDAMNYLQKMMIANQHRGKDGIKDLVKSDDFKALPPETRMVVENVFKITEKLKGLGRTAGVVDSYGNISKDFDLTPNNVNREEFFKRVKSKDGVENLIGQIAEENDIPPSRAAQYVWEQYSQFGGDYSTFISPVLVGSYKKFQGPNMKKRIADYVTKDSDVDYNTFLNTMEDLPTHAVQRLAESDRSNGISSRGASFKLPAEMYSSNLDNLSSKMRRMVNDITNTAEFGPGLRDLKEHLGQFNDADFDEIGGRDKIMEVLEKELSTDLDMYSTGAENGRKRPGSTAMMNSINKTVDMYNNYQYITKIMTNPVSGLKNAMFGHLSTVNRLGVKNFLKGFNGVFSDGLSNTDLALVRDAFDEGVAKYNDILTTKDSKENKVIQMMESPMFDMMLLRPFFSTDTKMGRAAHSVSDVSRELFSKFALVKEKGRRGHALFEMESSQFNTAQAIVGDYKEGKITMNGLMANPIWQFYRGLNMQVYMVSMAAGKSKGRELLGDVRSKNKKWKDSHDSLNEIFSEKEIAAASESGSFNDDQMAKWGMYMANRTQGTTSRPTENFLWGDHPGAKMGLMFQRVLTRLTRDFKDNAVKPAVKYMSPKKEYGRGGDITPLMRYMALGGVGGTIGMTAMMRYMGQSEYTDEQLMKQNRGMRAFGSIASSGTTTMGLGYMEQLAGQDYGQTYSVLMGALGPHVRTAENVSYGIGQVLGKRDRVSDIDAINQTMTREMPVFNFWKRLNESGAYVGMDERRDYLQQDGSSSAPLGGFTPSGAEQAGKKQRALVPMWLLRSKQENEARLKIINEISSDVLPSGGDLLHDQRLLEASTNMKNWLFSPAHKKSQQVYREKKGLVKTKKHIRQGEMQSDASDLELRARELFNEWMDAVSGGDKDKERYYLAPEKTDDIDFEMKKRKGQMMYEKTIPEYIRKGAENNYLE